MPQLIIEKHREENSKRRAKRLRKYKSHLNRVYNSFLYSFWNFWYIFELKRQPNFCIKLFEYIKVNQHLIREYNCITVTYKKNSFVIPPLNKEITINTDLGYTKITALSKDGLNIVAFRLAEPVICIPRYWGTAKIIDQLYGNNYSNIPNCF